MKKLILVLLILVTNAHAGWFDNKEEKQLQQQLAQQRQTTGAWQVIAGIATIGAITLLFVGAALGSRIRRHGNTHE